MTREPHRAIMKRDESTIDLYGPAMCIGSRAGARHYFERLVRRAMRLGLSRSEAARQQRASLGYHAGYYDDETRERVERLFRCEHPYFGSIKANGPPTTEQAWLLGYQMARALRTRPIGEA
jgi:hypothetical protein